MKRIRRRTWLVATAAAALIGAAGCSSDPIEPDLHPDFMVGDWLAESLLLTSVANSEVFTDLVVDQGAVFTLTVQPSGRYTAILSGFGLSNSESGGLSVDGNQVVLMPEFPPGPESRATWERVGDDVILVGESEFDFNLDGTSEPATLRQVLTPN